MSRMYRKCSYLSGLLGKSLYLSLINKMKDVEQEILLDPFLVYLRKLSILKLVCIFFNVL